VSSYWNDKPDYFFKDGNLLRFSLGKNIHFLDSLQMVNSSLDNIAKSMLNKQKIDTGYKTYTQALLIKWKEDNQKWLLFKQYLARDIILLRDIVHTLSHMFFSTYDIIMGEKPTVSSTALSIYFNKYYDPKKIFL